MAERCRWSLTREARDRWGEILIIVPSALLIMSIVGAICWFTVKGGAP